MMDVPGIIRSQFDYSHHGTITRKTPVLVENTMEINCLLYEARTTKNKKGIYKQDTVPRADYRTAAKPETLSGVGNMLL